MAHWGYSKHDGPDTWADIAPAGKGTEQSPVDIEPATCKYDENLAKNPLNIRYESASCCAEKMENNGHSVQVTYKSSGTNLTGGPLSDNYRLEQFHLHWGKSAASGSEHTVNRKMYAAELHLVHWNTDKFGSFGEAAQKRGGLCVLGIFLQEEGNTEHTGLAQLTNRLGKVMYGGNKEAMTGGIDPNALLSGNTTDYWTYLGSLTTPPLFESVTWVVFKEPIKVSKAQMEKFRSLHENKEGEAASNDFGGKIQENYRPPQPLNGRSVRASFK